MSDDGYVLPRQNAPRYCRGCGNALMSETTTETRGFDIDTGVRLPDVVRLTLRCPHYLDHGFSYAGDPARHDCWDRDNVPPGYWHIR